MILVNGYSVDLGHAARAVVLKEAGLGAAELAEHVQHARYEAAGIAQYGSLVVVDVRASRCYHLLEVAVVHAAFVVTFHVLKAEEVRVALVGIEVALRVEVGVLRQGGGLSAFVLTYLVVGAEQCARHAVNTGVQLLALVGVVALRRGHIVCAERYLCVVHQLHQRTVVRTGGVGVVHLDGDGVHRSAALLDADLLFLRKSCRVVILGKDSLIAVVHLADLLAGI